MIVLDNTDVLEGGASVNAVIDYTFYGLVANTLTQLAAGVMDTTLTAVLYTAGDRVVVTSMILVNKHSSAVNVTLSLDPANGGNPRYIIPKTISLGAGYSLHTDGVKTIVLDATGALITTATAAAHAPTHRTGSSDDLLSAPGEIGSTTPATVSAKILRLQPTGSQSITATTDTIEALASTLNISSNADYVMTSTPTIANGVNGQILILQNTGSFQIDLQDDANLAGSTIFYGGSDGVFASGETLTLEYNTTVGGWVIQSHPNLQVTAGILRVRNTSGSAIAKGVPVYISGWNSGQNRVTVALADADDAAKMPAIGVMLTSLGNNANGSVITSGVLVGTAGATLNTSGGSVRSGIWIGTTAGAVVYSRPTIDEIQRIGTVLRSHATLGSILVTGAGRSNDIPILAPTSQGITDNHIVTVDGPGAGAPNSGEYAKWTANGVEGKTFAEVLADLSGDAGATFDWNDQLLTKVKGLLTTAETELTISAGGAITVTQMRHKVDTASDASSDDLDTINGGATVNLIVLRAEADARTIVVKHNVGNIWLQGKADISLDDLEDGILLFWDGTNSKWFDIGGGVGGGGDVATDAIWDAAGDLVQGTGANTAARLAKGDALALLRMNAGVTAIEWGTGGQIAFPATAVPSADPNTLDDYEEGEWTPEVADASTGGNTASPGAAFGYYTKIGDIVHAFANVRNVNTSGLTAGNIFYIRNGPFTARTISNQTNYGSSLFNKCASQEGVLLFQLVNNTNYFSVVDVIAANSGSVSMLVSALVDDVSNIDFQITFKV